MVEPVNELRPENLEVATQRHQRGGIEVFVVSLPIGELGRCLPIPDPSHKFPDNRTVDRAHAESFADYWMSNTCGATPPLLPDTVSMLADAFSAVGHVGEVELGLLQMPSDVNGVLAILDGQYRTLGWDIAGNRIASALRSSEKTLERAHLLGDSRAMKYAESRLHGYRGLAKRLATEHITAETYLGVPGDESRQFYTDIATNAEGITKSTTTAFDLSTPSEF
ncbi:DNA sulfur modification protein DndB [Demequina sp.]|uniref:DNA sulfur modification protein DndB n=1 Tax=Demequina sp. TaxID=2050685 RepID=UPI0025C66FF9|nr:DNA sulfur modification protein DndB [Demequina sp.]